MLTTTHQTLPTNYTGNIRPGFWARFVEMTKAQQENRLLWLGLTIAGHGCVLTPMTLLVVMSTGMHFPLFMTALVAMAAGLIVNLAALPTKITIPVLILSVITDIAVMLAATFMYFG